MYKWLKAILILSIIAAIAAGTGLFLMYRHYEPLLPDISSLKQVEYQIPLRIFAKDGTLLAEFGDQKRIPVTYAELPSNLTNAFIAAEDDRYYEHPGVDYQGLLRAAISYVKTGQKKQGGSTITMQVARNFLLSNEKTFERKIKEILLALKIDRELSKEDILALYLNKIYLGHHAYGVGAAATIYFGKAAAELDLEEIAILAGLPKAPSTDNPVTNPKRAKQRRDYVLRRMLELGHINQQSYQVALAKPIVAKIHTQQSTSFAPYMAEMARQFMLEWYGDDAYKKGYQVYTTLDPQQQRYAESALQATLHEYSERHGYHGASQSIKDFTNDPTQWDQALAPLNDIGDTIPAVVTSMQKKSIKVYTKAAQSLEISWSGLAWAAPYQSTSYRGKKPTRTDQIVKLGDIIRIRQNADQQWRLAQLPKVEGAFIALNSQTGEINALQGGFDFQHSKYNRVVQSKRQPGSGFKPLVYTTALEQGFTAASIVNDAPIVHDAQLNGNEWRPENFSHKFSGPTRLRDALRTSRNLVSIRLMRDIGIQTVRKTALRFGFPEEQLPASLTLALGSGTASPLQMVRTYATFANGGYRIDPYFIQRIDDVDGNVVFEAQPKHACSECQNPAPRIVDEDTHYIMNSMLQDVVRRGTATKANVLRRSDMAGKTGTTNDQRDAWFNGYAANLVAISWVGFDSSEPLGSGETGTRAALPMWIKFMQKALQGKPELQFQRPENVVERGIDPETGLLATREINNAVREIFRLQDAPTEYTNRSTHTIVTPKGVPDEAEPLF